ncbi:D-alanyl-D-alanine carboxypeptidase/D-alanyl-D-alanine-endopeptidase [Arthrobacter sp. MYb227]|uniref:D-alanyl-D-alanine carboxypeptidase/D-alanyl-D-alanine endopeptidase n=1 Tax=Arthrobacter sp. MYb227 TaxID=1848601 RepID=UPI000CFAF1E9|nr:D-alanyl-D-alanine carboxypeptidase/D-alanyl-D-alanine-endopeptidase [Arthrobacter sp. MYb227]PQZ90206.1 D-alanyl-D-alanine carboxypeptidase/D-alanyl-D-alanine-endopeptidase [Arthrobacter sp. MYb227]
MKRARSRFASWILILVTGLTLGLVALFLIPVLAGTASPKKVIEPPVPAVITQVTPTALAPLDPAAPRPENSTLKTGLDAIFSAGVSDAKVSASVIDIAANEEIYSRSGNEPGIPASSLKILTALTATNILGEDHRFTTKVMLKDSSTLVLVGGGDVLLGSGADAKAISGRAGLGTLAGEAVQAILEAQRSGEIGKKLHLEIDDSLFTSPALNPNWDQSLMDTNNISAVAPLALYGARVDAGAKSPRSKDPAMAAGSAFASALRAELAKTAGAPTLEPQISRASAGEGVTELASISSATLGEQVTFMLEDSDNYVAEALGRLSAIAKGKPGDYQHGASVVEEHIAELGIAHDGLSLVDNSGLAAANKVSALTLASALKYAATSPNNAPRDLSYQLPVAGSTGTLSTRMITPSTRGIVRAKTGSLVNISSLTGLTVTKDGRVLSFSFLVNTEDGQLAPHKGMLDAAAAYLTNCGCR